jgi:hypothetical protein
MKSVSKFSVLVLFAIGFSSQAMAGVCGGDSYDYNTQKIKPGIKCSCPPTTRAGAAAAQNGTKPMELEGGDDIMSCGGNANLQLAKPLSVKWIPGVNKPVPRAPLTLKKSYSLQSRSLVPQRTLSIKR